MSDEMSIEKVIQCLDGCANVYGGRGRMPVVRQAIEYLESLQPKPTGRTVEEIREYCESFIKIYHKNAVMRRAFYIVLNFIDSAPVEPDKTLNNVTDCFIDAVEPVKVDDVCEWRLNGVDMYENGTPLYVSKFINLKDDLCPDCGRKILRKGE